VRPSGCCARAIAPLRSWPRSWAVSRGSLANWAGQADVNAGRAEGLTSDEREELRRLRRENKVLAEEREILKKAAAFFARDGESRR